MYQSYANIDHPHLKHIQGGPKKTGPLCYIASNFRNTA